MKQLLVKLPKTWKACIDCPFNYDGLNCRVYVEGYNEERGETFDPYEEIPEWCNINTIECYDEPDDRNGTNP